MSIEYQMLDGLVSLMFHMTLITAMTVWPLGAGLRYLRSNV